MIKLFDQKLRGEGICLEDILYLGEDQPVRKKKKHQTNRKYVPKMERKRMIDGRPVRDYPGERVTWTMVTAVEAVRRGRILDIFWRVSQ